MRERRSVLKGLAALPLIGGGTALMVAGAQAALASLVDPFPGYDQELSKVFAAIDASKSDEETAPLMDRWSEIDRLAQTTRPTTLAGAITCLEWARREHVQFKMDDGQGSDDPGDHLILALLDNALGVLRPMMTGGADGRT